MSYTQEIEAVYECFTQMAKVDFHEALQFFRRIILPYDQHFSLHSLFEKFSLSRKDLNTLSGATVTLSQSGVSMGSFIVQKYQREIELRDINAKIFFLKDLLHRR